MNNGLIVRELTWQLREHGFTQIVMTPQIRVSCDLDAAHEWLIEPVTREFVRAGVFTPDEGVQFLDDLRERASRGRYFLARTYYSVIATAE